MEQRPGFFCLMSKSEAASDIGESLDDSYRTYSGTKKWWRGYHGGFEWKVSLHTSKNNLKVCARSRNKPMGGSVIRFLEKDFPVFKIENGEETVTYKGGNQFLFDASKVAKSKIEEGVLREAIRRKISSLLF